MSASWADDEARSPFADQPIQTNYSIMSSDDDVDSESAIGGNVWADDGRGIAVENDAGDDDDAGLASVEQQAESSARLPALDTSFGSPNFPPEDFQSATAEKEPVSSPSSSHALSSSGTTTRPQSPPPGSSPTSPKPLQSPSSPRSPRISRIHRKTSSTEASELERHFFPVPDPTIPVDVSSSSEVANNSSNLSQISEYSYQQMAAPKLKQQHMRTGSVDLPQMEAILEKSKHEESAGNDENGEDENKPDTDEDGWQEMPVFATHDIYDDDGNIIAHQEIPSDTEEEDAQRGGAGKGYTRVTLDIEDAEKEAELDDTTKYLFNDGDPTDAEARSPLNQLQTTKELLTDTQRIAYVGLCKLCMVDMATDLASKKGSQRIAKSLSTVFGSMAMWSQKMSMRLYAHMDISSEEQLMIEQLSAHGVEASDLNGSLMQNSRVKNPMSHYDDDDEYENHLRSRSRSLTPLPEYTEDQQPEQVLDPSSIQDAETLDIDIRWTVLCDLFLVLVADSVYDARSRTLLERVAKELNVTAIDICKFEKRVTDALDIEDPTEQTWREDELLERRRKRAMKKKYVYIGLATLGGGLVIGLSAGLLAPVIGAGLAAGLTTVGITGTSSFFAGAGGAAIVTTTGAAIGARVGNSSMARRMGHVRTFEFRPLHNNERVNLIVTVSGWLSGKEDDVRLPFSTVDPIMGDIFSLHWEPDMLTSMGQTINLLATEVLTQSIQQVLGSTMLVALMASIQLPMMLSKLSYLLDNPWNVSLDRAWAAGLVCIFCQKKSERQN